MTTRTHRLWQPGNPQLRVFLPDFWIKILQTPDYGREKLPKNCFKCEVDPRMSRYDIRQYLEKIYKLPVRDVRTAVVTGEITWDLKLDREKRKALWKEKDKKYAFVFLKKGIEFRFPEIFAKDQETENLNKIKEQQAQLSKNWDFVNRDRKNIGEWFG
ncbi:unnamed protein product [Dracunculus medinensis]|uniref:Large ribosomal subunit protein uL23m n=1 Tax=Dracunculus medinensis TaxID=318479 RepID=A0A0N4UDJ7_DRAME|nr:unnamed protein product [Dracunculus medinensis]